MADPYRPEPRPTGLNTPNNPYYRRDRNVRVAREEESMQAFLTSGGVVPDSEIEAILAGTKGFALDPSDVSTMWQDAAKTIPVSFGTDPVGAIVTKWGTGSVTYTQSTPTKSPLWDGAAGLVFDGLDDFLLGPSMDVFQNVAACFVSGGCRPTLIKDSQLVYFGANAITKHRFASSPKANGRVEMASRRLDTDTVKITNSPAGLWVADERQVFTAQANYSGTDQMTMWDNGVEVFQGATGSGAGLISDTPCAVNSIGATELGTFPFEGNIGRIVVCPFIPTDAQRATIEAWIGQTPL